MPISSVVTNSLAKICQYLVANDNAVKSSMFNGAINEDTPMILYMERKGLEYGIAQNLPNLQRNANYVYSLLGANLNKANNILTNGGGGINVNQVQNSNGALSPYPINIEITAGQAGISTISNAAWVGLVYVNTVVINNSVYQLGVGFTFNSATGQFNFSLSSYTLQEGDDFSALAFYPITSSGSGGGGTSSVLTAYANAVAGTTVNVPILIGKTVNLVFRGVALVELIPSGIPIGNQVSFESLTGNIHSSVDTPFVDGELITAQYY